MNIEDEFGVSIPESLFHNGTFRQIAAAFDAQLRK
jgi:acyl carrier protein